MIMLQRKLGGPILLLDKRVLKKHRHLTLSGAMIWYLRDEQDKEIVINGKVILDKMKLNKEQD